MDIVDLAQDAEALFLKESMPVRIDPGVSREMCLDCEAPIPEARRKAVPGCQRCVDCQEDQETEHGRARNESV